jgi:phosphopantothenoylcysteine synthetase/decarboxylase
VVAPATFNFVNKLAQGIADDRATTKLCELVGIRPPRPIVLLPRMNAAHTRHPAWPASLATLRSMPGVTVLDQDVHEPGTPPAPPRWDLLLDTMGHPHSDQPA